LFHFIKKMNYSSSNSSEAFMLSYTSSTNLTLVYLVDTVVLEFNQYSAGSRWRQALVNRKNHREEGNEGDGFYGGVRKLRSKDDVSKWRQLWPTDILE
jgi:hypothetical protein